MKELFKIYFTGENNAAIQIQVQVEENKFIVTVWENGTGYSKATITDALNYVKYKYPLYKMCSLGTVLSGIFNFSK